MLVAMTRDELKQWRKELKQGDVIWWYEWLQWNTDTITGNTKGNYLWSKTRLCNIPRSTVFPSKLAGLEAKYRRAVQMAKAAVKGADNALSVLLSEKEKQNERGTEESIQAGTVRR